VIDAHTGAFLDPRWKRLLFLHKWFSKAARTTIVTNEYMFDVLRGWHCNAMIVRDVPVRFAQPAETQLEAGRNMTLVATFTRDEPIELFFQAAALLPEVRFHVTGDYRRAPPRILAAKPPNIHLTGFLSNEEYVGLLLASDAVLALTTMDHTMQRAAYEAMYLGRPVVTSNFDLLRRHFRKGSVHVDNRVEDIVAGVRRMYAELPRFQTEIQELRDERIREWSRTEAELREMAA